MSFCLFSLSSDYLQHYFKLSFDYGGKLPQANKSQQQKPSSKVVRTSSASDKYAGKFSAEIVVDRSKLPVSMQNRPSPSPGPSSTTGSYLQPPMNADALNSNSSVGQFDLEHSSTTSRNSTRRQTSHESPTKQFYQYGSAGFDLYKMRDDDIELDEDEDEEEIISNDSSVSEMTNPTFFSQQESLLFSRNANIASIGLNSQKIERGPTPSESESSIDQSESATPLIGSATKSASHSSQERGGQRAIGAREESDDDSEQTDDNYIFSSGDWKDLSNASSKIIPFGGLKNGVRENVNKQEQVNLFSDPPLDCVDDDTDSESSDEAVSISEITKLSNEEMISDMVDDNQLHLSVAAIRSARRQTKIEYDVKLKAIDFASDISNRGSLSERQIPLEEFASDISRRGSLSERQNRLEEFASDISHRGYLSERQIHLEDKKVVPTITIDYSTSAKRRSFDINVDRMNIAEVGSRGNIRQVVNVIAPTSRNRKRDIMANQSGTDSRRSYSGEKNPFDEPFYSRGEERKAAGKNVDNPGIGKPVTVKPFDEGDFDDEICEINEKRSTDPITYAGRSVKQQPDPIKYAGRSMKQEDTNSRYLINDRSITPIMSSRRNAGASNISDDTYHDNQHLSAVSSKAGSLKYPDLVSEIHFYIYFVTWAFFNMIMMDFFDEG